MYFCAACAAILQENYAKASLWPIPYSCYFSIFGYLPGILAVSACFLPVNTYLCRPKTG
jgi:hypothetical protein